MAPLQTAIRNLAPKLPATCLALALALPVFDAGASAGTSLDCDGERCTVTLTGPISAQSLQPFQAAASRNKRVQTVIVEDCPGGEVATALTLGRILRAYQATLVLHGTCASACVLMAAGAVERAGLADGRLILHRPGWQAPAASQAEAEERSRKLNLVLEAYLLTMGVRRPLLDAINTSEEGRPLLLREAVAYGLTDRPR